MGNSLPCQTPTLIYLRINIRRKQSRLPNISYLSVLAAQFNDEIEEKGLFVRNGNLERYFATSIQNTDIAANFGAPVVCLPIGKTMTGIDVMGLPGNDEIILNSAMMINKLL